MVQIAQEREKIRRAKEIIRTTNSENLKRDLKKYVHRAEGEIRLALSYMGEGKACQGASTPTASQI